MREIFSNHTPMDIKRNKGTFMKLLLKINICLVFLVSGFQAFSQNIEGLRDVTTQTRFNYSFSDDGPYTKLTWDAGNGVVREQSFTKNNQGVWSGEAGIIWSSEGTGEVRVLDDGVVVEKITVTITPYVDPNIIDVGDDISVCAGGSNIDLRSRPVNYNNGTWTTDQSGVIQNGIIQVSSLSVGNHTFTYNGNDGKYGSFVLTVNASPNVTISTDITNVILGKEITLTSSGATTYQWTGNGLQSNSGPEVKATPPVGTQTYKVRGTNSNGCYKEKSLSVTVRNPVNAGPDVTVSKGDAAIDLRTLPPDYSSGTWTGQNISNGFIGVSTMNAGQYTYTYTRSVDGSSDSFTLFILQSIAGTIDPTLTPTCDNVSGKLTLRSGSYQGDIKSWSRSYDNGNSWSSPFSAGATFVSINETQKTRFRVTVQQGNSAPATTTIDVEPLGPTAGTLSASQVNRACENTTGRLVLQNASADASYEWQKYSPGSTWTPITGQEDLDYDFAVSQETWFKVIVSRNGCTEETNTYRAYAETKGGSTLSSEEGSCGTATGSVRVSGNIGEIKFWESSVDNSNWAEVDNSQGLTRLNYSVDVPTYYRAVIQLVGCAEERSTTRFIDVTPATQPGIVRFIREVRDAEIVNGNPIFYPEFELRDNNGEVSNWYKYIEPDFADPITVHETSNTIQPTINQTTGFRANIQNGDCPDILSGQATFVVNRMYLGEEVLFKHLEIDEYTGNSYRVANAQGLTIQDGFVFHANSIQEFFVVIDDSYLEPPTEHNFVLEETIREEGIVEKDQVYFANAYQRDSKYTYFDELGRPIQQVDRKGSPALQDVIVPMTYDQYGRMDTEHLPYIAATTDGTFQTAAIEDQLAFYEFAPEKMTEKRALTSHPFAKKVFEASPLNRVFEQGAPGLEWQPDYERTVKFKYEINNASENILNWDLDENGKPVLLNNYETGELMVNTVVDEKGSSTKSYTDKQGNTILKRVQNNTNWVDTYYVYNSRNLLVYVVQPEGIAQLSGQPDQIFLDTWAFQYQYDQRNRMIGKRVPGADWVYMVYDDKDRLVLTQDGNQRVENQWNFTKYDYLNRPVVTGIYKHIDDARPNHTFTQGEMDALISTTAFYETRDNSTEFGYTTNNVFPSTNLEVLTVSYYDNYDFMALFNADDYGYKNADLEGLPANENVNVFGLTTGSQVKVLDTDKYLTTVSWYDNRYRVVQTSAENNLGGIDRSSQAYDFTGNVMRSVMKHVTANESHTIAQRFDYDHKGRMLGNYHSIDDSDEILLSDLEYNDMGQLVNKNLHTLNDGTYSQSVDYRYNIRGWLTHINNAGLTNDGITNNEANDYFGFEINYENPQNTSSEAQFNGNISEVIWNSFGGNKSTYSYTYDPLNRLQQAAFQDLINPANNGKYSTQIVSYDNNGNIQGLLRGINGITDELSYTYQGNQLLKISDQGGEEGFRDGRNSDDDYKYDGNGNSILDLNKDIESISYNHLNLPNKVLKTDGQFVNYIYDAYGTKLAQETYNDDKTLSKRTDYDGEFVYETKDGDEELALIQHTEGNVVPDAINGGFAYQYYLKDHLGNTRVVFTTKPKTHEFTLNYESDTNLPDDEELFTDLNNIIPANIHDHTDAGSTYDKSQLLNGANGGVIGSVVTIPVGAGDKVSAEVWAKYLAPTGTSNPTAAVGSLLIAALTGNTGINNYEGSITSSYGTSGSMATGVFGDEVSSTEPKAFINLLFLPDDVGSTIENSHFAFSQISSASSNSHAILALDEPYEAPESGYVVVYLSNESNTLTEVYFDDLVVTVNEHPVIEKTDYYPFGLRHSGYYQRVTAKENKYNTFQGQERIDDLDLGWVQFKWRNHDPSIGRFFNVDPLAENFYYNSPYAFAENRVINGVELEGLEWENFMSSFKKPSELAVKPVPSGKGVQHQSYNVVIANPKKALSDLRSTFKEKPQDVLSNSKADFQPVDGDGNKLDNANLKEGSFIEIGIFGLLNNSTVKVTGEESSENGFSYTFSTLEGHIEAGEIKFSASQNEDGSISFGINSTSKVDSGYTELFLENTAREEQGNSWQEVLTNVVNYLQGSEQSRTTKVEEDKD
uniref:DUF1990 family protein n=1 Tax=Fulvivirga sp. TaxID=1931237 RepID=UPI004049791E